MLKLRIIPVELLSRGRLVKSVGFAEHRDVGDPVKSSKVYSDQDADELIILNIERGPRAVQDLATQLRRIARECFVPITAGGGIRTVEDAALLFDAGADKVSVCSAAFTDDALLQGIASRWGSQALVVCADVRKPAPGDYRLYADGATRACEVRLEDHLQRAVRNGAGEIVVQSVDRDGHMQGYDAALVARCVAAVPVPVIALGGAGQIIHLKEAFDQGAQAAACGSLFNFGDNNPLRAKALLKNYNVPLKKT